MSRINATGVFEATVKVRESSRCDQGEPHVWLVRFRLRNNYISTKDTGGSNQSYVDCNSATVLKAQFTQKLIITY